MHGRDSKLAHPGLGSPAVAPFFLSFRRWYNSAVQPITEPLRKLPADAPVGIGRMDLENSQTTTVQHELLLTQLHYV